MRMAALSRATGVPVATLKYYVREGLLHPGVATAVNQAQYDETHVRRVRLVRTLVELGRLSIADVAAVVAAVDDESVAIHDAFGLTQDAMVPRTHDQHTDPHHDRLEAARRLADDVVARNGLRVRPEAAVRAMLADAIVHLADMGLLDLDGDDPEGAAFFDSMAAFFQEMAEFEIGSVPDTDRAAMVEFTVVGTVVVENVIAALRRMALEDASERRFGSAGRPSGAPRRSSPRR